MLRRENIYYDITVHLGRTLSRRNSRTVHIDVNTKDRADKNQTNMKVKPSRFQILGKLQMHSIILGPSGSGKTVLLQNMIVDI